MFQTKIRIAVVALLFSLSATCIAEDSKFIRVQRNKKGVPTSLQTATSTYTKTEGREVVSVDLIGVVHIADAEYYDELNEELSEYDALLYELVAEKENQVVKKSEEREQNILSTIQKSIGEFLGLEHQVSTEPGEGIIYERQNFVHADMTPTQLQEEMAKNGDSQTTLILSTLVENMRKQNKEAYENKDKPAQPQPQIDLLQIVQDPDGPIKIKRMMAEQFDKMTGNELGAALTGYIVDKRNVVAMKVFDEQVANGKKNLGIFYGAAHMQDFEKQLEQRGYKKTETRWNTAWDMRRSTPNKYAEIFKLIEAFTTEEEIAE